MLERRRKLFYRGAFVLKMGKHRIADNVVKGAPGERICQRVGGDETDPRRARFAFCLRDHFFGGVDGGDVFRGGAFYQKRKQDAGSRAHIQHRFSFRNTEHIQHLFNFFQRIMIRLVPCIRLIVKKIPSSQCRNSLPQ